MVNGTYPSKMSGLVAPLNRYLGYTKKKAARRLPPSGEFLVILTGKPLVGRATPIFNWHELTWIAPCWSLLHIATFRFIFHFPWNTAWTFVYSNSYWFISIHIPCSTDWNFGFLNFPALQNDPGSSCGALQQATTTCHPLSLQKGSEKKRQSVRLALSTHDYEC